MPAKKKTTRATRTKNDVKDEFDTLRNSVTADQDPIARAMAKANATAARSFVSGLTVDEVVTNTTNLGLDLQKALANVTEQLTAKLQELETVKTAIVAERQELENLHNIDVSKTSVDMLIEEYDRLVEQHETDTAERRAAWLTEQQEHAKQQQVITTDIQSRRAREEAEYQYNLMTQRRTEADQNAATQARLEKDWADREAILAARETELGTLRTQVADMPATIKSAVDKEVAIVTNSMKRDHTHQVEILRGSYESKIALLNQRIESDNVAQAALARQVDKLQAQLDAAKTQVSEIARQALEASSGKDALSRVMELQNTNNGTVKSKS